MTKKESNPGVLGGRRDVGDTVEHVVIGQPREGEARQLQSESDHLDLRWLWVAGPNHPWTGPASYNRST